MRWSPQFLLMLFLFSSTGHAQVATSGFSIDTSDRNVTTAAFHRYYGASEGYASTMAWTGNVATCLPGTVSPEFTNMTLRRINYFRAQGGLPSDIVFSATKNAACQEAAIVFAYQNQISHSPASSFPSNPCITQGAIDAAANGNLNLGVYGPTGIDTLMKDPGGPNYAAGHRRWLMYSLAREMGHGAAPPNGTYPYTLPEHPAADVVWVLGDFKPSAPAQAVPWPNEGYVPWQLVPNEGDLPPRWSYSYPGANFTWAKVTMSQNGTPISASKERVDSRFGDATIVWRPSGIPDAAPASDTPYTVTISGISDAPFSSVSYTVTVIDPLRVNDPPVISGSATPFAGVNNTYTFSTTSEAEDYELCIAESSPGDWAEGAESTPSPMVIDDTDSSYGLISTAYASDGSRSFHLATPAFGSGDSFRVDRASVPQINSEVTFRYRRFYMHPDTKLRVELSGDAGSSFETIGTIDGQYTGNSSQLDGTFLSGAFSVPAKFIGQSVQIRFRLEPTGTTYLGSDNTYGMHIDNIQMSNSVTLTNPSTTTLGGNATEFSFNPTAADQTYYLQVRPQLGGQWLAYGPVKIVTASALTDFTPPEILAVSPTNQASAVVLSPVLAITFDEPVIKGHGDLVIKQLDDDSIIETVPIGSGTVELSNDTVTIQTGTTLQPLTGYYVEIDSGAFIDLANNSFTGLSGSNHWRFTTMDEEAIRYVPITGDADSGISTNHFYTHLLDFGLGTPGALVNGVQFHSYDNAANGTLNFNRTITTGQISHHSGLANHPVTGGLADLLHDMYFNGVNEPGGTTRWTLSGLTPGQSYETRIYVRGWPASGAERRVNLQFDPDGAGAQGDETGFIDEDDATTVGFPDSDQAYYLSYSYTAGPEGILNITAIQQNYNHSWHLYGLSNQVSGPPPPLRIGKLRYTGGATPQTLFTFPSVPGRSYRIEAASDLHGPWFELVSHHDATGTETTFTDTVAAGMPTVYYRIRENE